METRSDYQNYLFYSQQLKNFQGRESYQAPYKESFEAIYNQANDSHVTLETAKTFLHTLSQEQLVTLQHYTSLADTISIDELSEEGAYNLLMHDNEKYDFDNDGFVSNGAALTQERIPKNMPDKEKQAYIKTLNQLNDGDRLNITSLFLLPVTKNDPTVYNYETIQQRVDNIINPIPPAFTSDEVKNSFKKFWNTFSSYYQSSIYSLTDLLQSQGN